MAGISSPIPTTQQLQHPPSLRPSQQQQQHQNSSHPTTTTSDTYLPILLPSGTHPLSGISLRAHLLGLTLGLSASLTLYLLLSTNSPLWRAPFFISILSIFHFLEFWVTAAYNTPLAKVDAFLLSTNGMAYNAAHSLALVETVVVSMAGWYDGFAAGWVRQWLVVVGVVMIVLGQGVRSVAMAQAGRNFNHTVQWRRNQGHELVTGGVYGVCRHPSYFGFFWWGLGTQVVLGNVACFIGYAAVLWLFFAKRIQREEQYLTKFFGEDYIVYKKRTWVGIPFIS